MEKFHLWLERKMLALKSLLSALVTLGKEILGSERENFISENAPKVVKSKEDVLDMLQKS